jgi:hypothetical protein
MGSSAGPPPTRRRQANSVTSRLPSRDSVRGPFSAKPSVAFTPNASLETSRSRLSGAIGMTGTHGKSAGVPDLARAGKGTVLMQRIRLGIRDPPGRIGHPATHEFCCRLRDSLAGQFAGALQVRFAVIVPLMTGCAHIGSPVRVARKVLHIGGDRAIEPLLRTQLASIEHPTRRPNSVEAQARAVGTIGSDHVVRSAS